MSSVLAPSGDSHFQLLIAGKRLLPVRSPLSHGDDSTLLPVRFIRDIYIESYDPTYLRVEEYDRQMMVDGELSSLNVLDTSGAEQFTSLNEVYIKSGQGFVLVFRQATTTLAQQASLDEVKSLRKQIFRLKGSESLNYVQVPMVVAATEWGLISEPEVPMTALESLANDWNIPFYQTSPKRNLNVNDVFEDLLRQMRARYPVNASRNEKKQTQGPCIIM
ncbi:ras family-domain-containing protein [Mycena capillaripes]|nr:ras family-domain-containing protein [Mycena capillaripes]